MPVWQLASILRISKRRPRVAVAPIYDSDNNVVTSKDELRVLWASPFAAEFFGQVTGMSSSQMSLLLEDCKLQFLFVLASSEPLPCHQLIGLPQSFDECLDLCSGTVSKDQEMQASWP